MIYRVNAFFCKLLIVIFLFAGKTADGVGCRRDYSDYDKDSQHSDAHISEVMNEFKGLKV